jgi:terminal uridylyltransferase
MMQTPQSADGGLEDRLRGMILRDSGKDGMLNGPQAQINAQTAQTPRQEDSSGRTQSKETKSRRPNQAQRRQLSSELNVALDSRAFRHTQWQSSPQRGGHRESSYRDGLSSTGSLAPAQGYQPLFGQPSHPQHDATQSSFGQHGRPWAERSIGRGQPTGNWRSAHSTTRSRGGQSRGLYNPGPDPAIVAAEAALLDNLCAQIVKDIEIHPAEIAEKETFRVRVESICRKAIADYEATSNHRIDFNAASIQLKCFGSLASGFATKASDLDLALLSPLSYPQPDASSSPIPRLVEKALLDVGMGARLLTKARVPIIKTCESPPQELHQALTNARADWDKGILVGVDEDHADAESVDGAAEAPEDQASKSAGVQDVNGLESQQRPQESRAITVTITEPAESDTMNSAAEILSQGNKSLADYYSLAKRLLHKQGGRDIVASSRNEIAQAEYKALNEFILMYVRGLTDSVLKERLLSYANLSEFSLLSNVSPRSLSGVYAQMEGEKVALLFLSREVLEKDQVAESRAQNQIKIWNEANDRADFGRDPFVYGKQLQGLLDRLKQIPSLQLLIFAQEQYESASRYHERARRLQTDLGVPESSIIRQYVQGIHKPFVRKGVEDYVGKAKANISFNDVARRHKSLQLAYEFERALEKNAYDKAQRQAVEAYIRILRDDGKLVARNPPLTAVIHLHEDDFPLLERIYDIGNPALVATNLPRDRYHDKYEFPKDGAGVQCDINFSAHLALQNTMLLRCYAQTDPRVRPMVLFVKHWAKQRNINTPYRGTLSSYGYVLMVLHYLVNVAEPFVCPNLQMLAPPARDRQTMSLEEYIETVECKGRDVRFWRDEQAIQALAARGELTPNTDSVGHLLRGFFEYFAKGGPMSVSGHSGFDWGREVLSLRTPHGLQTKQDKGWTGAKTVLEVRSPTADSTAQAMQAPANGGTANESTQVAGDSKDAEVKEVRHRYLLAIEDPFELDHNVARTVTHQGIVAIRGEFRRAWNLIRSSSRPASGQDPGVSPLHVLEKLVEDVTIASAAKEKADFAALLEDIHGSQIASA